MSLKLYVPMSNAECPESANSCRSRFRNGCSEAAVPADAKRSRLLSLAASATITDLQSLEESGDRRRRF
jgi:hypothetical protein